MAEENELMETSEDSTHDGTIESPAPLNLDQKIQVGGQEYSLQELAESRQQLEAMEAYASGLESFREATGRLMNPETDSAVKKRDARQILLDMNYSPEQVDEWVKVYDEAEQAPMTEEQPSTPPVAEDPRTNELNQQVLKMRAQMLQQNLENSLSTSIESDSDGKVLLEWMQNNREGADLTEAKNSLAEKVKAQTLENLRNRRNHAGSFDDSWVGEEVKKAANKVAKDMLTVIGDPSKIGRVPETAGQTETLHRKDPVKVPDTKGKTFGEVEAQLRDWTSDQLLRSLSDTGGESKA